MQAGSMASQPLRAWLHIEAALLFLQAGIDMDLPYQDGDTAYTHTTRCAHMVCGCCHALHKGVCRSDASCTAPAAFVELLFKQLLQLLKAKRLLCNCNTMMNSSCGLALGSMTSA